MQALPELRQDAPASSAPAAGAAPTRSAPGRAAWLRFALLLAALLALLPPLFPVSLSGDVLEYTLDTVAVANHGTPDIRVADIDRTVALMQGKYEELYRLLQGQIQDGVQAVFPAFARGSDGKVYPIHFFGYPMMAAIPFRVLDALGLPPFKGFQVANLAFVFVLGLAMLRFFGSARRAFGGVALFMLCFGALYWKWSSPECISAAALLGALLLFASRMPVAGSLLAGLAAQQNPTIVFFFAFAPLLRLCLEYDAARSMGANLRAQADRRTIVGLVLGVALAALPVLFNLLQYGVPNLIASRFSDPALVDGTRLLSFYFDLNQGMIVGIPGVLAALLLWMRRARIHLPRMPVLLAVSLLFTLALALPALAVLNWNSDAAGVMRYAFWAAMPLVFVLLLVLRALPRWPLALVATVVVLQSLSMLGALRHNYVSFGPLPFRIMKYAPQLYHPEPEIFAERMAGNDNWVQPDQVYTYRNEGYRAKTLVHAANPRAATTLCGPGATLDAANDVTDSARGWRYIDGPVLCRVRGETRITWLLEDIVLEGPVKLGTGWSRQEVGGDGIWSDGARSRLAVRPRAAAQALVLRGSYLAGKRRTRVSVNGHDLGWHALDGGAALALPAALRTDVLDIELEHEAVRSPAAGEPRLLAFFLKEVSIRINTGTSP
ncbi:hypothetical protein [Massilia yuzhufengensis]|uniref:Uncharacterized protein n=1 Tax=Massilia yuzhufengensis TaxID=1164594 RepID=A0A1I1VRT5_9BURK|nr:hypothetical protein [Massilia yuzhufengensis]SFD85555.1 hypothetical protein SAMN05216204_14124 [Massilia yuzhufengensis]